jgi:hypothetical protein
MRHKGARRARLCDARRMTPSAEIQPIIRRRLRRWGKRNRASSDEPIPITMFREWARTKNCVGMPYENGRLPLGIYTAYSNGDRNLTNSRNITRIVAMPSRHSRCAALLAPRLNTIGRFDQSSAAVTRRQGSRGRMLSLAMTRFCVRSSCQAFFS